MRFIRSLTALSLASLLLSGCVVTEERLAKYLAYDESESYAMNVTSQFFLPRFKDTPVPKGVYVANGNLERDVALTTLANFAGSGTNIFPGGFGVALGMDILGSLGEETPPDMLPHILAFVDATKFPTRKDAEMEATAQVYRAVRQALVDTGMTISQENRPVHGKSLWIEYSVAAAKFENEALGCKPWSQFPEKDSSMSTLRSNVCWVDVKVRAVDEDDSPARRSPDWIDGGRMPSAWRIWDKAQVEWNLPEDAKIDADTLYAAAAKYLPDNYWFYVEPRKKKGQKKRSAPYLLSNKGAHYFVVEQKEDPKKK